MEAHWIGSPNTNGARSPTPRFESSRQPQPHIVDPDQGRPGRQGLGLAWSFYSTVDDTGSFSASDA